VLLSGTPKSYVKTAESGNKRRHAFCGDCGTPIYACAVDNPLSYALRVGTITQRAAFSPRRQIWRRSAAIAHAAEANARDIEACAAELGIFHRLSRPICYCGVP